MQWFDRLLRSVLVAVGIAIVGWSVVSVGCLFDPFRGLPAEELRRTIEDTDWDAIP